MFSDGSQFGLADADATTAADIQEVENQLWLLSMSAEPCSQLQLLESI